MKPWMQVHSSRSRHGGKTLVAARDMPGFDEN
jgi:hypothetical protein